MKWDVVHRTQTRHIAAAWSEDFAESFDVSVNFYFDLAQYGNYDNNNDKSPMRKSAVVKTVYIYENT